MQKEKENLAIVSHAKMYGVRAALKAHSNFMEGYKNRSRVLKKLLLADEKKKNSATNLDIIETALHSENKKALAEHTNFFPHDRKRYRKLTQKLRVQKRYRNDLQLIKESYRSKEHNFTRHANVEISSEELRIRVNDFATNMRRRANDPLPCTFLRGTRELQNIADWNDHQDLLLNEFVHSVEFYQQIKEFHELTCNKKE
jgi:hypothetical protein